MIKIVHRFSAFNCPPQSIHVDVDKTKSMQMILNHGKEVVK